MLLEQGVNPKVVQKLLGHRDIETTLGTYSHVLPEVFDGVAGIVGKLHVDMMAGTQNTALPIEPQGIQEYLQPISGSGCNLVANDPV